jgi:predicted DNA-binding transcriptional regulator AlpA
MSHMAATAAAEVSAPTLEEVKTWPATVPVPQAGAAFGFSRSYSYELISRGEFPARVIRRGRITRVVTASIVETLDFGDGRDTGGTNAPACSTAARGAATASATPPTSSPDLAQRQRRQPGAEPRPPKR